MKNKVEILLVLDDARYDFQKAEQSLEVFLSEKIKDTKVELVSLKILYEQNPVPATTKMMHLLEESIKKSIAEIHTEIHQSETFQKHIAGCISLKFQSSFMSLAIDLVFRSWDWVKDCTGEIN